MSQFMRPISLLPLLVLAGGCGGTDHPVAPEPLAVFVVEVAEQESFRIALSDPDQIAAAEEMLASGKSGIVYGALSRGDGGFNAPYSWHLRPETVTFPDLTVEACSGRPMSDVEEDLDYWIDTLGAFCPWGSRVVARHLPQSESVRGAR